MRAFVTGGSGFVGRNLIRALAARGDEVRGLARSDAAAGAVTQAGGTPAKGDLDDEAVLALGMAGCDVVFHAAAKVEVSGRRADFQRINIDGTRRMTDAARTAGVRRFVHVSTEAVLVGGPPIVRADESWPLPRRPLGPYPWSKGRAEAVVRAANGGSLETVIVRPRFVWGPGDTSLVPKLAARVNKGKFAWIGGGRHLTSTCHVDNLVALTLLAAERAPAGETYFVTDGEPIEFRWFLTRLLRAAGVEPGDRTVPRWVARALASVVDGMWRLFRLSGDPPVERTGVRLAGEEVTVLDDKARRELGWTPVVSIEEGLAALEAGDATPASSSSARA